MDLSFPLQEQIVSLLKGPPPPLKGETETTDDFQTRSIEWIKQKFNRSDALVFAVLLMQAANWLGYY